MAPSRAGAMLRLARVQTIALTALAPVIGAAVFYADSGADVWGHWLDLLLLFLTGACFHVYGFVLNEVADIEVDRASGDLATKPLVAGEVSARRALVGSLVAGMLGFVPLAIVGSSPWPMLLLPMLLYAGALGLGAIYNAWGKKAPLDSVLAGSLSALLLSGVAASGGFDLYDTRQWWLLVVLVGLQFSQNLFQNAIEGGIKDADHDAAAGARTFATLTGTRVEGGIYRPSALFAASAYLIWFSKTVLLFAMLYLMFGRADTAPVLAALLCLTVLAVAVTGVTVNRFVPEGPFDRPRLKRLFSAHEMATYLGIVATLIPLLGLAFSALLLAVPVAWFVGSNLLLYGRPLEPGV